MLHRSKSSTVTHVKQPVILYTLGMHIWQASILVIILYFTGYVQGSRRPRIASLVLHNIQF